jgi:hypothetical protein
MQRDYNENITYFEEKKKGLKKKNFFLFLFLDKQQPMDLASILLNKNRACIGAVSVRAPFSVFSQHFSKW